MKNLTKAQVKVVEGIISDLGKAQNAKDYSEYVTKYMYTHSEEIQQKEIKEEEYKNYYTDKLNNIALTWTSTNTLKALEKKGYIRIINIDSIDTVEFLRTDLLK